MATVRTASPSAPVVSTTEERVLENDHLRAVIQPSRGGKLISLLSKRTGIEWLLPPLRSYADAQSNGGFEQWDGGGFDECLPTVSATQNAPDHGELWRQSWHEHPEVTRGVLLSARADGGALLLERMASLEGTNLLLEYRLTNKSSRPQPALYCAHPLLRVELGDRMVLPAEVTSVRVESSAGDRLGRSGEDIAWPRPRSSASEDVSVVGPPDGMQADKLFAGPLTEGRCTLLRPSAGEGLELTFPVQVLPWVGLWICRDAWPADAPRRQYTVAFEPSSAPHDSLDAAVADGTAWQLAPGEQRTWTLRFRVVASGSTAGASEKQ